MLLPAGHGRGDRRVHRRGRGRARGAVDHRQRHARAADAVRPGGARTASWSVMAMLVYAGEPEAGRAAARAVPRARDADRRHGPADALPGDLPAGRRATTTRPRRPARCSSTASTATRPQPILDRLRPRPAPDARRAAPGARRRDGPRAGRRDGVRPPPEPDHGEPRRALRRTRASGTPARPGSPAFAAAVQQGDRGAYVNFLGDEGEARVRAAYPGADLGPPGRRQAPLRPDQPVPAQPEHPAERLTALDGRRSAPDPRRLGIMAAS